MGDNDLRILGIDAGGTKTLGLLADREGVVLAEARGGGANLRVQGEEEVERVLAGILRALAASGRIAATCLGMAGVDRPHEKERMTAVLRRLGVGGEIRVENDALIALAAGEPKGVGIVVVSGTGSIAFGVEASGKRARSGGWGYLLGDEGSGFWLGHAAVRQGIRAAEGRGPETLLESMIRRHLGLESSTSLLEWFYDPHASRRRLAELASLVEEAARQGDAAAEALLDEAAWHLAQAARAVARQLDLGDRFPVVLAGGAFRACPSLASRIESLLELPQAQVAPLEVEPALGAVRIAQSLLEPGAEKGG